MAKTDIYRITLLKWAIKNPKHKDSYKKTLIENRFTNDAKVKAMPLPVRWLLLGLILECGQNNNETITMTEQQVNEALTTRFGCVNALNCLKEFQMVSYEVEAFSYNRKEVNRKEIKRKEIKGKEVSAEVAPPPSSPPPAAEQQNLLPDEPKPVKRRGAIPAFDVNDAARQLLAEVPCDLQEAWIQTYPSAEWVLQEIGKANVWIKANPKKAPKQFGKFMTNWLARGFEDYRKGLPSRRMTASEVNAHALADLHKRVQDGEV